MKEMATLLNLQPASALLNLEFDVFIKKAGFYTKCIAKV